MYMSATVYLEQGVEFQIVAPGDGTDPAIVVSQGMSNLFLGLVDRDAAIGLRDAIDTALAAVAEVDDPAPVLGPAPGG